jgi:ABC-2 type transport system ATP-binding protein
VVLAFGSSQIPKLGFVKKMITVKKLTKLYQSIKGKRSFLKDFFARQYEEKEALCNLNFSIGSNELVGLIGPNGAGKTTTMKILSGILYPTSGQVEVLGYFPFDKKPEFLKQISFIMGQKNQLIWELPPRESYLLNQAIYEISDHDFKKHLNELTELLAAEEIVDKPVRSLSLGQRMRAELIASLLHQPKVLFLDEPTIGLDIFAQTTIINFLRQYQERHKATIILTSHYMKDIASLAKRVILINEGHLLFDGRLSQLVTSYSKEKFLQIILKKPLTAAKQKEIGLPFEYQFPVLKLKADKDKLLRFMNQFLVKLEFSDFTLEDEPIEEVVKKAFAKKQP